MTAARPGDAPLGDPPRGGGAAGWLDGDALGAAVVASSPLAIVTLDAGRTVRSLNAAAELLLGRAAAEVVGSHVGVLFPDRTRDETLARLEEAGRGQGQHLEFVVQTGTQAQVQVGMSWGRLLHDGDPIGLVGVGRDITRRKLLEHELSTMAASLRELGASTDLGMYRLSFAPRLRVDYLNPVLEERLGYRTDELGQVPSQTWRLAPAAVAQLCEQRRGTAQAGRPVEASWLRPDGTTILMEIREVPMRDVDGQVTAALGLVADVTAQRDQQEKLAQTLRLERQATDELRRVDELRRLFLQAVSHELRTPLTSVLGFASTLQHRYDRIERDDAVEMAARIHEQGQRIERLLDDLLDIERLSRGVVAVERRPLDLAALVTAVTVEFGDDAIEIDAPPTSAQVDAAKVERILLNLLTNARRHAGGDAHVIVRVEDAGPSVRIIVEDDGPGLADELKDRVFEPFEQGPRASAAASPGTGIGLALVSSFAQLHGGSAWAEDSDLGGARFVVELRREAADGPEDGGTSMSEALAFGRRVPTQEDLS